MKEVVVFGAGNIGSVLIEKLRQKDVQVKVITRSFEETEWKGLVDKVDAAFIAIPTTDRGEQAFEYERAFLEKRKPVITCEKASVAYHWETLKKYKDIFKYTASVGGGTKMLKEISTYRPEDIKEIKAVVNGTLNYISDELEKGKTKEQITKEVLEKGYAEPGAFTFEEVIIGEMKDVVLKTIIIANHSGMFGKTIQEKDIEVIGFEENKRCVIYITKEAIRAGFIEDSNSLWLPDGVNNVLYVNGEKKVFGPGAGAEATVSSMLEDCVDI